MRGSGWAGPRSRWCCPPPPGRPTDTGPGGSTSDDRWGVGHAASGLPFLRTLCHCYSTMFFSTIAAVTAPGRTRTPAPAWRRPCSRRPPSSSSGRAPTPCPSGGSPPPPGWPPWACTTTSLPSPASSRPCSSRASNAWAEAMVTLATSTTPEALCRGGPPVSGAGPGPPHGLPDHVPPSRTRFRAQRRGPDGGRRGLRRSGRRRVSRAMRAGLIAGESPTDAGSDDLGQYPRLGGPGALGIGFVEDHDAGAADRLCAVMMRRSPTPLTWCRCPRVEDHPPAGVETLVESSRGARWAVVRVRCLALVVPRPSTTAVLPVVRVFGHGA